MRPLALLVVAGLAVLSAGCLRTYEAPHTLHIVSLDLSPERVLSQEILLNVTTILDNRGGGDSGHVRLVAKAYSEDNGFLLAENETVVGTVAGDTTKPVSTFLRVPREGSVRIDVAIFEDEQGQERASIAARNLGTLEPEVLDTGLRVRDVDFLVQDVTNGGGNRTRARIQTDLYVTNEGDAASEDLRVQVKAREVSTRLVSDVAWVQTGSIAPGATVIRSVNLTVPDGYNYVFEILTWRGDIVVARNEGTVQLAPTFEKPKDTEVVTTNPNINDFLQYKMDGRDASLESGASYPYPTYYAPTPAGARPAVPGFEAVAALGAIVLAVLALSRRGRR